MKPGIPKGTRDFLPGEVVKRQYIFDVIKRTFETFGYLPIETPVMENLSTLTGKYGEEGDRLLFKILNNGDFMSKADEEALRKKDSVGILPSISKRGLRYDLTVPFARFVTMHQNEIQLPFKRYQIQQVWRADRPQKGRYQEFYQCDVDAIGSESLVYEAELVQILDTVFTQLGMRVDIKINNRKILYGIAEYAGIADHFMTMTIAIDKLDKIGANKVIGEMMDAGIPETSCQKILNLIGKSSITDLEIIRTASATGAQGLDEVQDVFTFLESMPLVNNIILDASLARGLNYYTGCIFEVQALDAEMGSVAGGGRYDDLTAVFGMNDVSGVGVSFGAERIYDVMDELDLFPKSAMQNVQIIFLSTDDQSLRRAFKYATTLRKEGVKTDIYPKAVKLKKQFKYAGDRGIPFVGVIGERELEDDTITLKNMTTGQQESISLHNLIEKLSQK